MCMVLWLVNSACMAGVHTPTKPAGVGGMLLVQCCYKHVLSCLCKMTARENFSLTLYLCEVFQLG